MKKFKLGLQLYSIRHEMEKDVEAALKKVSEMGYEYVEFAGYYGKTAEELKEMLDKYCLKAISVHQGYEAFIGDDAQKNIDFLKTIGVKYAAIPGMGLDKHKGSDVYEKVLNQIGEAAENLKENGIQMMYHNHAFEFEKYEGKYYMEWLIEDLQGKVLPEFDVCWVHYAGVNPQEYILNYKNRIPVLHIKDFACTKLPNEPIYELVKRGEKKPTNEENGLEDRAVGYGIQDIPAILKSAEECDTEYLIVEQEEFTGSDPLAEVKKCIDYLKTIVK